MRWYSNASVVRCKKLVFCRRHGGVDITRVHKLGASAKLKHNDASAAALVNLVHRATSMRRIIPICVQI